MLNGGPFFGGNAPKTNFLGKAPFWEALEKEGGVLDRNSVCGKKMTNLVF